MCDFNPEDIVQSDDCKTTGGVAVTAYYALHADIDTFPVPPASPTNLAESATITTPFVMKATKYFHRLDGDLEMQSLNTESAGSLGNLAAMNRYKFRQAGNSPQLIGFINAFKNKNLQLIVEDADGQKRTVGNQRLPARMESFQVQTGEKAGDDKFVEFIMYGPGLVSLVYDSTVPVAP
jgi:hypothetical protein